MDIFSLSGLINGIVALFFGGLVFVKDWRDRANQIFFLMTLSIALWAFGYWQWLLGGNEEHALYWIRLFSIGSMFIPVFFFHWATTVLKINLVKKWFIRLAYAIVIFFIFLSSSSLFIEGVEPKLIFDFWPNPGIIYSLYLFFIYFGLVLYALALLLKYYKTFKDHRRAQLLYIMIGVFFGFGGGATNFFLWYDIPILPYGNFFVALFPFLLGYAALRYSLFNIKVIATELLTFSLWIFILLRLLLANSLRDQVIEGGLLLLVVAAGAFLVRSVREEVKTREKIEALAKDLEKANVRLKGLDQLKSEFLSLASHQFRSPLTAMKGYASLILEGSYGEISPGVKEAVDRIFQSTKSLVSVVQDFLDVSRIEQGRMKYEFQKTDVVKMVNDVMGELRPNISKAGLKISFDSPGLGKIFSSVDLSKMRQVIINLLDNAQKYTPKGSIEISVYKDFDKVMIEVSDTGVGIPKGDEARLFDKFTRNKSASKTNIKGTGLGLYVVKKIIEAHEGQIWAESRGEGKGSTFFVELKSL